MDPPDIDIPFGCELTDLVRNVDHPAVADIRALPQSLRYASVVGHLRSVLAQVDHGTAPPGKTREALAVSHLAVCSDGDFDRLCALRADIDAQVLELGRALHPSRHAEGAEW